MSGISKIASAFNRASRSQRGATMAFALVFLLVATVTVSVILSAAVSAVSQERIDQEREQGMLALQSAGKVVCTCLERTSCDIVTVETTEDGETVTETSVENVVGPLGDYLKEGLDRLIRNSPRTGRIEFTVNVSGDDAPDVLKQSQVKVGLDVGTYSETFNDELHRFYTVDAELSLLDSGQKMYIYTETEPNVIPDIVPNGTQETVPVNNWSTAKLSTKKGKQS